MILNTTLRVCKTVVVCTFLLGTFLSGTAAIGQSYVNDEQAVVILKSQVEQLENEAISLYQAGNTEDAVLIGYRVRYVQVMLEELEGGTAVAEAIQASLPNDKFVVSTTNTSEEYDISQSLAQIRTNLNNWADDLLKQ